MNIGIDANCLIFEKAGVGNYSKNLVENLLKIDRKNHYFLYFTFLRHRKQRLKQINEILPQPKLKNITLRILPLPARWYEFLIGFSINAKIFLKDNLDIFFAPYASGVPKNFGKNPPKVITTIHDLVFLRFPLHRGKLSRYYLKRHKIAVKNSSKIIAVSKSTKIDLQEFLKVAPKKIVLIYEAASPKFKVLSKKELKLSDLILKKYFDPNIKYILNVGTIEPRKNLGKLLEAYSILPFDLKKEYHLVIVGSYGWNNNEFIKTLENLNLQDKVILPGFVKDEDMPYIYNRATCFVYPSLFEGFGLPPLEAMACGVPVITSRNSSLTEVVGLGGILIDPQNDQEIAEAIKKMILKPRLAQKMRMNGLRQAKKFSWKKAALETLKVFQDIR